MIIHHFVCVQSPSHVQLFATPWTAACQAFLSLTISWSLPKFMSIASAMPSDRLILCHPILFLPSVFPSIRVLSNELALRIRWPKYWSFSISPSNECIQGWFPLRSTGLISLLSKGLLRVFSITTVWKHQSLSAPYGLALTTVHDYWKYESLDWIDLCWQSDDDGDSIPAVKMSRLKPRSKRAEALGNPDSAACQLCGTRGNEYCDKFHD